MKLFDEELEANLQQLAQELKSQTFQPRPARRVYIAKTNGGRKLRPLAIPSIRDRIVQEALRMILEPIFEADFSQYSYGFRPNRSTMDAVKSITWQTTSVKKFFWVVEGDVSSYFDTINHRRLIKIIRTRVKDEKIIRLIWKFLRAGVMEGKLFRDTNLGTSQGGIISPLLANIYLNELDRYMQKYMGLPSKEKTRRRVQGEANFAYVRYADDFVILCNGTKRQAEEIKEEIFDHLKKRLRLRLSKEKTKVTHINDGFKFLGFEVKRELGSKGMKTKVLIPKEAERKLVNKLLTMTAADRSQDSVSIKILALNRVIGGWCRYYQYTSKANTRFRKIAHESYWLMAHWLGRKLRMRMPEVLRRYTRGNTFVAGKYRLRPASEYATRIYRKSFLKPNPYTKLDRRLKREELSQEAYWTGYEDRPGMGDLRPTVIERDGSICQICDKEVKGHIAEVDHIKPVRRFKRAVDANYLENLWTVCKECHRWKSEFERQVESRMQ